MSIPRLVDIDAEFTVATSRRAAQPVPLEPEERWPTATQLMRENPNITGTQLMVSETFLCDGAKKTSMMIMINSIRRLHGDVLLTDPDSRTQMQMIGYIQREFQLLPLDANREAMINIWIHNREAGKSQVRWHYTDHALLLGLP